MADQTVAKHLQKMQYSATQYPNLHWFGYIFLYLLIFIVQAGLDSKSVVAEENRGQIVLHENSDYFGFDLLTQKDVSLDQCKANCLQNLGCAAFTYNISAKFCFLKSDFAKLDHFQGAVAGRVVDSNSQPDIGAPAKLSFVTENMHKDAQNLAKNVAANKNLPAEQGFVLLSNLARQRLDNGDIKAALNNAQAALRINPEHQPGWVLLSDAAYGIRTNDNSQRRVFQRMAVSAAVNGYSLSRTKISRAASLASLARGLQIQRRYRAAINAYKMSLGLNEVTIERANYANLRREHGFKITNHTVDSDNLSPRICIQFSEDLDTFSTRYEDFISLDQKAVQAVNVKKQQICVEGLSHGKNYKIVLRKGLPSTIGENLLDDVNLNVYVKDRAPAVRFTGSNFVLPSSARHGIPLVTVNSDKASLKLFRVGERALAPLLRDSNFLHQLGSYQVEYLVDELGEAVWEGSIDIKPELNKEVVTSIPIDETMGQRKPGVYFLTAQPSTNGPEDYNVRATQWFVISDIGLTSFHGEEQMQVFARSLSSANAIDGVEVTLIARNNEVLGKSVSDANGMASFDAGLLRGTGGLVPTVITAKKGADEFVFLDVLKPGFDLSDRGVQGREAPKGVDVYAWSERGIYRAGESVHISALARNASARAIEDLPLTFVFTRPDGVEERRIVDNGAKLGGYFVELVLTQNAKRGTWQLQVYTDPKSDPVAEHRFLVEDFLTEKTDFKLIAAQSSMGVGKTNKIKVEGRYLYGAPAAGLTLEGDLIVRTKRQRQGYEKFLFGLSELEEGSTQRIVIDNIAPLNSDGESTFEIRLDKTAATTKLQSAQLVVRMREGSGRAVERRTEIDVIPQTSMIGVRPQFEGGQIAENTMAGFDIIGVDRDGQKIELANADWSLVKIDRNYQWYRNGSSWNYETVDIESKVADGTLDIKADGSSKLSLPVQWGRYRLDLETSSEDGPATSVEFNAGWFVQSQSTDTPDGLEIGLDKSNYKIGDVAKLKVSPRFAGEMLIAIGTDRIIETRTVTIPLEGKVIDIVVGEEWGAGAYVMATLYRTGQQDSGQSSRMPMRAIGIKWLDVDPQQRALEISLNVPAKIKPHQLLSIPINVAGLKPGEEAYVNVAAIDIGILNLTNYQSPDPVKQYFGQRKLGIVMRDIYGQLIDGSLGAAGRLRTGGDGPDQLSSKGSAPTQKLIAFYSGPVRLDANGKANVKFDIPQFNGSVRIMAVAWSRDGVGGTQKETIIRDEVVISAALPKFLAPGDEARILVEITNTDAPSGKFDINFDFSENLKPAIGNLAEEIELLSGKKTSLSIPITAGQDGKGWVRVELSREDGFFAAHEVALNIRSGSLPVTRKIKVALSANGGSVSVDKNLLEGHILEGAKVNISVALADAIDVPSLLLQLNHYPYGCAEQITSKALPLLYVSEFPISTPNRRDDELSGKIQKAIDVVLSYQSSSGGFSLWGSESDDLWLGAYVTDFLTRAIEKGYKVPRQSLRQSLQNLQNVLAYQDNLDENDAAIAYSLYVLARNRLASAGDLRYYIDTRLQSFKTPIARAQLAAAMALYGDQPRAEQTFRSAFHLAENSGLSDNRQYSYGSKLRDAAALLALASESRPAPSNTVAMKQLVLSLNNFDKHTSTQEQAWMLLASRANKQLNDQILLNVNGLPHTGAFARQFTGEDLTDEPVQITNRNAEELQAIVTSVAIPDEMPPAGGDGFSIERKYYRLDGMPANISQVKQNERFVVVIKIKQHIDVPSRIIVTDLLPAGFEIDNPRLVKSAELDNFKWLPDTVSVHSQFLDDRFVTAFNHSKGGQTDFSVAYMVRAVTPGVFLHPAASVEDMYRPHLAARTAGGWMRVDLPE